MNSDNIVWIGEKREEGRETANKIEAKENETGREVEEEERGYEGIIPCNEQRQHYVDR
jgi:hypothetical protein